MKLTILKKQMASAGLLLAFIGAVGMLAIVNLGNVNDQARAMGRQNCTCDVGFTNEKGAEVNAEGVTVRVHASLTVAGIWFVARQPKSLIASMTACVPEKSSDGTPGTPPLRP